MEPANLRKGPKTTAVPAAAAIPSVCSEGAVLRGEWTARAIVPNGNGGQERSDKRLALGSVETALRGAGASLTVELNFRYPTSPQSDAKMAMTRSSVALTRTSEGAYFGQFTSPAGSVVLWIDDGKISELGVSIHGGAEFQGLPTRVI